MDSINSTLKNARAAATTIRKKSTVPATITEAEANTMKIILKILQPFAELTDDLQGDGVTSSLLIIGLVDAIDSMWATSIFV